MKVLPSKASRIEPETSASPDDAMPLRPRAKRDRLASIIRDTQRAFARALQAQLAEQNVPIGHWYFLTALWIEDGITQKELSERTGVMEPTTFGALKSMENLGYVERRQRPDNKKNIYVHLTPLGRALEMRLTPLALMINEVGTAGLDKNDIAITRRTLLGILDNLERRPAMANTEGEQKLKARTRSEMTGRPKIFRKKV